MEHHLSRTLDITEEGEEEETSTLPLRQIWATLSTLVPAFPLATAIAPAAAAVTSTAAVVILTAVEVASTATAVVVASPATAVVVALTQDPDSLLLV